MGLLEQIAPLFPGVNAWATEKLPLDSGFRAQTSAGWTACGTKLVTLNLKLLNLRKR